MSHHSDYRRKKCPVCGEHFYTRNDDISCSDLCKEVWLDKIIEKGKDDK
jgi:predicted nucleic acid-binding Zn ribbon protein